MNVFVLSVQLCITYNGFLVLCYIDELSFYKTQFPIICCFYFFTIINSVVVNSFVNTSFYYLFN